MKYQRFFCTILVLDNIVLIEKFGGKLYSQGEGVKRRSDRLNNEASAWPSGVSDPDFSPWGHEFELRWRLDSLRT